MAFVRQGSDRSGTPSPALWWDHEAGGWSPTYDESKHLRAFVRTSDDPASPFYEFQAFAVPMDAIENFYDMQAYLFTTAGGVVKSWGCMSRAHLGYCSGA